MSQAGYSILNEYKIIQTIGSGYSCKVKLGEHQESGLKVALKILKPIPEQEKLKKLLASETKILKELIHPAVIQVLYLDEGTYQSKKEGKSRQVVFAVMRLASGGELHDYISKFILRDDIIRHYFRSLVNGMVYIHKQGVVHRDLKAENLLLDSSFNLKIADFGFATIIDKTGQTKTSVGTRRFMAPELDGEPPYDAKKIDVFAAGIILFIMYYAEYPFKGEISRDAEYRKFIEKNQLFWEKWRNKRKVGEDFENLLTAMLSDKSSKRPSFEEILDYDFCKKQINDEEVKEDMRMLKAKMDQSRKLRDATNGDNRDETGRINWEEIANYEVPAVKMTKLPEKDDRLNMQNGIKIILQHSHLFVAIVVKTLHDFKGIQDETIKNKLVYKFQMDDEVNEDDEESQPTHVSIDVKFYELPNHEYHVQFMRLDGDYIDYLSIKSKLMKTILTYCDDIEE